MSDTREICAVLAPLLEGEVRGDDYTRHLYSADASMYSIEPLAVAFPRSHADVAAIVTVAAGLKVPVLPRGAGTSLGGQAVGRAIVIDLSRHMNRILELDGEGRRARVEPGVVQDRLNRAAARHGLLFGPDTSTGNRATVGGMIGNNSAGSHSIIYGSTIDHIEKLEVVLADAGRATFGALPLAEASRRARAGTAEGRAYREVPKILSRVAGRLEGFPPFWRHSGGYQLSRVLKDGEINLARLVVGSEGTLAIATEAEVRLVPRPRSRAIAVGHFHSVHEAIAGTPDALARNPGSVELIDRTILDLARDRIEYGGLGKILEGDPSALLFVEFFGDNTADVAAKVRDLARAWAAGGHGYHTLRALTAEEQEAVLRVRSAGLGLLMAASVGTRRPLAFVEDTAVPPEVLIPYIAEFTALLDEHGMRAGIYGHCSVGCLHIRPFVDLRKPGEIESMRKVAEEVADLALRYGGVNSSEHGDGLVRSEFNRRLFGDELYEAMRQVKKAFDPDAVLNPGKIVDAPPMTDSLRDPALPPGPPLPTTISFAAHGGMRGAADRCMRIGACRKRDAGAMCPSYMATLDEEHSTRGRANALVKALSEPDPGTALGSERLHEILDLCLECKACKSECPLGVDMAALKSEFLDHYQQLHGVPLRSRLFAGIRRLNRLGAAAAPLSNWPGRLRPVRALMRPALGISHRRPLPSFQRQTLIRWFARRPAPKGPFPRGELVLLADSFTTYTEPSIGRAAVELLELAGWKVRLEAGGCCGRASISKGLLKNAQSMARSMVGSLAEEALRGIPITGVEPSCLLTLKDEYLALLPDDQRAEAVASQARLVPELLVEAIENGWLALDAGSPLRGKRIVFHGHCHEKAVVGTAASRTLLKRIPGVEVQELDAGCCGMAGSFGFETEHYDLSMKIGGLRLFPALQAEPETTVVAATGVSCRQQIAHGAGRRALHPIELVRQAVIGATRMIP